MKNRLDNSIIGDVIDVGNRITSPKNQTKGVVQETLFGRFSINLSALSGGTISIQKSPIKGRIIDRIDVGNRITSPKIKPRG